MAGVTNPPFRTLCRRYGAGLYVSEMITARALVEGNRKTVLLASFGSEETTRSLQLYGVDPHYVGEARWQAIAALKQAVTRIPVLGNGDIWEAEDALRMMRTTGCDGVIVGRGCLGRPWLFRDLADVFEGREPADPPDFAGVISVMLEHARLLVRWLGEENSMRAFRKHTSWYTKGFRGGYPLRQQLLPVSRDTELASI